MANKNITLEFDSALAESMCDAIQGKLDSLAKLVSSCLKAKQHEAVRTINTEIKSYMKLKEEIEKQAEDLGMPVKPYDDK